MLGQGHPSVEEETQRHWPILKSCFLPDSPLFSRMGSWSLSPIWNLFKYLHPIYYWLHSVQFSHSVVSDSLRPHESQHTRPPCPSPIPGVHANSCALSQWCHLAISSSVVPFSSCPQSLPASESFPMSQLFAWGDQSTYIRLTQFGKLMVGTVIMSPLSQTIILDVI